MSEILHIFRKDVRSLWTQIVILLLLIAAHAYLDVVSLPFQLPETARISALANVVNILLPLAIFLLVARVVFEEELTADRQFWLTRPYHRGRLLAAKILFVVAFVNVPLFLSDCYILAAQGFPVLLSQILLRQVPLTILWILPSFALATITSGVAQFIMAWLIVVLAFLAESMLATFFAHPGLPGSVAVSVGGGGESFLLGALLVVTCAIVVWQYWKRRTAMARAGLLAAIVLVPALSAVPWHSQARPRAQSPNNSGIRISYAETPNRLEISSPGELALRIPLKVEGLPPRTLLRGSGMVSLELNGVTWPEAGMKFGSTVEGSGAQYWQRLLWREPWLSRLVGQTVNLQTTFDFEVVTDEVKEIVPVTTEAFRIAGVGLCRARRWYDTLYFTCRAGLDPSIETTVQIPGTETMRIPGADTSKFGPAPLHRRSQPWGLSPASDIGTMTIPNISPNSQFEFRPRNRVAAFQQELDLKDISLSGSASP